MNEEIAALDTIAELLELRGALIHEWFEKFQIARQDKSHTARAEKARVKDLWCIDDDIDAVTLRMGEITHDPGFARAVKRFHGIDGLPDYPAWLKRPKGARFIAERDARAALFAA